MNGARWRYFYNRLIDLSGSADDLLADMDPKTVAKIRMAETEDKMRCDWQMLTQGDQLEEIAMMWNQSIEAQRRWGMLNRSWLGEMISARVLEVAAVREMSGELLVYAVFFRDKQRVQQLMSVSPPRAALSAAGRAKTNRASSFLVWRTLLRLKEQQVEYFDFGGWYPGGDDIQLLGANAFKKSFGGEVVQEFECQQIITLKGWLGLNAARLIARAKDAGSDKLRKKEENRDEAHI
ncbi:MAG TPA: hypothetical protein VL361_23220 [Candidatus Limnocylindrales bacterium]|nr:hypothetical protein [Candidatus Limnocylindrales bacterium]